MAENIGRIVRISTNEGVACKHCDFSIGLERFEKSVNHYIQEHGYELLHVGQESSEGDGGLWHHTVAVLGSKAGTTPPIKKVKPLSVRKR